MEASTEEKAPRACRFQNHTSWGDFEAVPWLPVSICNGCVFRNHLNTYFNFCRAAVQASPSVKTAGKIEVESLLFHGTRRACLLGEDVNNVRLCALNSCSLCSIIRSSFDIDKCGPSFHAQIVNSIWFDMTSGSKHKFMRFGQGIYTTSCSSSMSPPYASPITKWLIRCCRGRWLFVEPIPGRCFPSSTSRSCGGRGDA